MQTPQYILAISALLLSTALGTQRAGAFTEPWQVWVKQPIATPMTMATIVTADSGAQVQFSVAGNTYTNTGLGGGQKSTNIFYVPVKAHQQYPLQISGSSWSEAEVHFTPYVSRQLLAKRGKQAMPKPYKSFINNSETNDFDAAYQSSGNHATNFLLEVRPDNGFRPSFLAGLEDRWSRDEDATSALAPGDGYFPEIGPGRSTNAWSGAFRWGVSLGRLWNGSPCGMVRLDEVALGGSLYSAAPLTYTARSTNTAELLLVTNSTGQLRQIRAPQTLLDVQATNSPNEECILKFYLLSQVGSTTNSSGLFPINTDDPFVVWHVKNPDSPGTSNRVQFIEVRPGRTITSEVQYSNLVWSLKTGSGAELRTETRTVSVSGPVRTETVEIKSPTNSVYKALERYKSFAWGWELTNVISDPDGAKLTNSFTYYEDSNDQLEFGKLKDHVYPGGRWERSCYMNSPDCPGWPLAGYFGYYGAYTEMVIRPWMDGPSDVSGATVDNVVQDATTYTGIDIGAHTSWDHEQFFGIADYYTNETSWTTGIDGGSETGNIVIDYSDDIIGSYQLTYRYDCPGNYLHDLPGDVTRGDETAEYYEYSKGTFNASTRQFTTNEVSGTDFRSILTRGQTPRSGTIGGFYQGCGYGQSLGTYGSIEVHIGKATQEVGVYQGGNLVYKQVLAMQDINSMSNPPVAVFLPTEQRVLGYDSLGHQTNEVWIDAANTNILRTVYQACWVGANGRDCELKAWEINETGEKFTYAYDSLKRPAGITHTGVSQAGLYPAQSDISTNFVYDAAGRVIGVSRAAGSLSLSRAVSYDLSGRVTSASGFDGTTTNITYSADTRTVTQTVPGGITYVLSYYLDGRPKSLTGTGQINEFYTYSTTGEDWYNSGDTYDYAKNVTHTDYSAQGSGRWRERLTNLGNTLKRERYSGFGAGAPALEVYYEVQGGLALEKRSPATMSGQNIVYYTEDYTYNGYGALVNTVSGSAARSGGTDTHYEYDGANWFLAAYTLQNLEAGSITNGSRRRLSGYTSTNVLAQITLIDPDTNSTTVTVYLDRAAKKITVATNSPQSAILATNVTINGLLQTLNSQSVATPAWIYYDALGRPTSAKDSLGNTTSTTYDLVTGWITTTTDAAAQTTTYQYYSPTEASAGKLKCQIGPTGKRTWYDYTARSERQHVWGEVPYPEERIYNSFGELTELRTFQGGTSWSSSSTWPGAGVAYQSTTWSYDAATGVLLSKTDASGHSCTNNYLLTRAPWTRTWARGVTATNTVNDYGEIIRTDYSDGTPSVIFDNLNLAGEPTSITDALGARAISYDFAARPLTETWGWPSPLYGLSVINRYGPIYGRNELRAELSGAPFLVHDYLHDGGTGRLNLVSNGTFTVAYAYVPNSDLLQTTTCKSNSTTALTTTRAWDYGMRLRSINNVANNQIITSHSYVYDQINRRRQATLEDGSIWNYDYNDRNELTGARRDWSDWSPVSGQQFGYGYDNIGNRHFANFGGDTNGWNLRQTSYTANNLNQYTAINTPGYASIIGLALATNTVVVNGNAADRKVEYFHRELGLNNSGGPLWTNVAVGCAGTTNSGGLVVPGSSQALTYDADGNLTFDGTWTYEWDGENRLAAIWMTNITSVASSNRLRLEFTYDYQNRRVSKTLKTWSGSGFTNAVTTRFIYDGGNLIAILNPDLSSQVCFMWGNDLSGAMDQAGGVGGLVLATLYVGSATNCFAAYDGNGNVTALINAADGSTSARYEYSPYGETLRATGSKGKPNPLRFSTKFADDETGLAYYGYRYYSTSLGRWLGRDAAGKQAENSCYLFVQNQPGQLIDPDGRSPINPAIAAQILTAILLWNASAFAQGNFLAGELDDEMLEWTEAAITGAAGTPKPPRLPRPPGAARPKCPKSMPNPTANRVRRWIQRGPYYGGMFAVVGGLLAINGTAAAMGQFDTLTQTFADFAGHAAGGDKAYAELDAATFAAQLQTGGSDYFFTMSMLDSLLQIEDNQ